MGRFDKILSHEQSEHHSKNVFVFVEGDYKGGTFECPNNGKISLGRDLAGDVVLVDNNVSRNHASIFCKNGKAFIRDLGSTNGTKLNGENIVSEEDFELYAGDLITMGASVFRYGREDFSIFSDVDESEIAIDIEPEISKHTKKDDTAASIADKLLSEVEMSIAEEISNSHKPAADAEIKVPAELSSGTLKDKASGIVADKIIKLGVPGVLRASIDAPFNEKIKIDFSPKGIASAESLTHPSSSPAKTFARFLLSSDGKFSFSRDGGDDRKSSPELMELLAQANVESKMLQRYKDIISFNKLLIKRPLITKLSMLSKAEIDTFQFMINADSVIQYLDSFKDVDEFILLDQIDKMMARNYLEAPKGAPALELEDILDI